MIEQGIIEAGRTELLEGIIYEKLGQKEPHAFSVAQLAATLGRIFGEVYVRQEKPLAINFRNEPEPDVAVTRRPRSEYVTRGTPTPAEIVMLAEVSDSSLPRDLGRKAKVYARAGITEYWVLDLNNRRLIVHRQPSAKGYAVISSFADTESVASLAKPDAVLAVADMLP